MIIPFSPETPFKDWIEASWKLWKETEPMDDRYYDYDDYIHSFRDECMISMRMHPLIVDFNDPQTESELKRDIFLIAKGEYIDKT